MAKELYCPEAPPLARKPAAPGVCGVVNKPPQWKPPAQQTDVVQPGPVVEAPPAELASDSPEEPAAQEVDINLIDTSPFQIRRNVTPEAIEQLAENIREVGLNAPVTVRPKGARFELIAGETRWRACKALGYATIPITLRNLSDKEAAKAVIADNPNQQDCSDYELALGVKTLQDQGFETTISGLARILGRSRQNIYRYLTFFSLPAEALAMLDEHPFAVGGHLAEDLADYADKHSPLVTEAVSLLCSGKLTQTRALTWLKHRISESPTKSTSQPVIAGGRQIGMLRQTAKDIRFIPQAGLDLEVCLDAVLHALQSLETQSGTDQEVKKQRSLINQ